MKNTLQKMVALVQAHKRNAQIFALSLVFTMMAALPVFASGEGTGSAGNVTSSMTDALQTGFASVKADVISIITVAIPPALVVMGLVIALTVGIRWFRRAAK